MIERDAKKKKQIEREKTKRNMTAAKKK